MTRFLQIFGAQLRTALVLTTTYRAEMVLWALSGTLPIILMGVWSQAASSGSMPYTPVEMVRYFIAVLVVRQLTFVWVIWDFEEEVVSGRLSNALLRPIDPVWNHVANHLAERLARLPMVAALVVLCFALYPEALFIPSLSTSVKGIALIALSFAVRFLLQYTLAMLCFVVERASSLESLLFIAFVFFSGMLAPLDLYPAWVAEVASWTPFPYFVYIPAKILSGGDENVSRAALMLLAWGAVLFVVRRWAWHRGTAHFSAMGA